MIIHSVVRTVKPGTMTSVMTGECEVECFDDIDRAYQYAERCNQCAMIPGIIYRVESLDEESPERVPTEAMRKAEIKI